MSERVDQLVAKHLFKYEPLFFFVLLFVVFFWVVVFFLFVFLHLTALSYHMSQIGTFLPSTSNQKYLLQNTVISHIGKTFYCCPVLPTFSIKFFFRVDLKHFRQSHGLVLFMGRFLNSRFDILLNVFRTTPLINRFHRKTINAMWLWSAMN